MYFFSISITSTIEPAITNLPSVISLYFYNIVNPTALMTLTATYSEKLLVCHTYYRKICCILFLDLLSFFSSALALYIPPVPSLR